MKSLRIFAMLALAAMLSGCYTTEAMYSSVGSRMRFDAPAYACGAPGGSDLKKITLTEEFDGKGGVWYQPSTNIFSNALGGKEEHYAFHPIYGDRYLVSMDSGPDYQIVMVVRVSGESLDLIMPTPEKTAELEKKHNVTAGKDLALKGTPDDKHAFLMDVAMATEGTQVIYQCRAFR